MGQAWASTENCCSKSEQTEVEQVEACQPTRPPAPLENAIYEEGVAGMTSPSSEVFGFMSTSSDSIEIIDLTKTNVSAELLRGISLQKTLHSFGRLWRRRPADLNLRQRAQLYGQSEPVAKLDVFISHAWHTPGKWKFLSLLLQFGWKPTLLFWAFGTSLSFILSLFDVLPQVITVRVTALEQAGPAAFWLLLTGLLSAIAGLTTSPYISWTSNSRRCFVDIACIHQADEQLMKQGILKMGAFLAASSELRVLWSAPYLSRLWCIFELAAYRKVNPTGKISLAPVYIEMIVLVMYLWMYAASIVWWFSRTTERFSILWFIAMALALGSSGFAAVHALRYNCQCKKQLIADLDSFDVMRVECQSEYDKACIHTAIENWYGSLQAFSAYVRGPLREDVLKPMQTPGSVSFGYICLLTSPLVTVCLEGVLAMVKAAKPLNILLGYILSYMVGLTLLLLPALLVLLIDLCERGAVQDHRCKSYLQSLGIAFLVLLAALVGSAMASLSYRHSIWMSLGWVGVASAFAGCVRRCCWHR
ncbi:otud5-a [Symbiodinium necroappetens]|uniref:Otud5-a protein n=1 Tax=Symbiodinium necroappetens TaxID=1628268 RepID=A0A812S8M5_9DINO|nr:otud5-a [Symbiodinium necroappetens]